MSMHKSSPVQKVKHLQFHHVPTCSNSLSDCFELYNPASEDGTDVSDVSLWIAFVEIVLQDVFHATVNNWVTAYLEMAQKVQPCQAVRVASVQFGSELAGRNSFIPGRCPSTCRMEKDFQGRE